MSLSDQDTSRDLAPDEAAREIWSYEVDAAGPDRAATVALKQWQEEVGRKLEPRSLTVIRLPDQTS